MRSRSNLILVGLVTALTIAAMVIGCSDDETPTTTVTVDEVTLEETLDVVSQQVTSYLDSAVETMASGLSVATWSDVGSEGDIGDIFMGTVIPDTTILTDWIVSWATDLQAGVGTMSITDSLSYEVNGVLTVEAHNADQMYVKHHYSFDAADTNATFTDLSQDVDLHIAGIDGNTATINGDFRSVLYAKEVTTNSTTWDQYIIEGTFIDLEMTKTGDAWTSGCPNAGTCTLDVQYTYAADLDLPVTTLWNFTITFTDGVMDVDVAIGNLTAAYEETICTP
jgi:hypothetical protein